MLSVPCSPAAIAPNRRFFFFRFINCPYPAFNKSLIFFSLNLPFYLKYALRVFYFSFFTSAAAAAATVTAAAPPSFSCCAVPFSSARVGGCGSSRRSIGFSHLQQQYTRQDFSSYPRNPAGLV